MASLCGLAFSSIQIGVPLNPTESITNVSPSHQPTLSPKNVGSGSCECLRPSTGIDRKYVYMYRNTTRLLFCTISNGSALALCLGIPPMMHKASGSTVFVRLCCKAACPAGVSGNLKPGWSLPMLPTGVVAREPFQNPLKSGCPSGVLGAGPGGVVG